MASALSFFVARLLFPFGVIFFLYSVCGEQAFAVRFDSVSEHLCSTEVLARRTGVENCWARFSLPPSVSAERVLCIPHRLWIQALSQGESFCGQWKGAWKARSFPANQPGREPKRLEYRFYAEQLPQTGTPDSAPSFWALMGRKVENVREQCSELFRGADRFGILRKLLLNESVVSSQSEDGTDRYQPGVLRLLGFVHLYTASGIHLYSLALCIHSLCLGIARMFRVPLGIMYPGAKIFSGLGWLTVWILCGMRPGLLRPWIVVMLRAGAHSLGFRWRFWSPLVLALLLDGVIEALAPQKSLVSGRWHYALAVGGGLLAMELRPVRKGEPEGIKSLLHTHFSLSIGSWLFTAVLDAWQLGWVATMTPALSLLTLPLISSVIYPAIALTVAMRFSDGIELAQKLADQTGRFTSSLIEFFANYAMDGWTLWCVPRWALLLGAAFAGCVLLLRSWKYRKTVVTLVVCLLLIRGIATAASLFSGSAKQEGEFAERVEQLDVGQGDAALVLGKSWVGLVDAGSERSLSFDAWIRLFVERGITRLNWIALTHLDEDHVGGVRRLVRLLPVACVAMSPVDLASSRGEQLRRELRSLRVRVAVWGDHGCFPFFATALPSPSAQKTRNEHMSALWIPVQSGSRQIDYLSMGDASSKQESWGVEWFLRQRQKALGHSVQKRKVILKVSHHGSRHSTFSTLLERLRPSEAWISNGVGNRFGHPAPAVLGRLREAGIPIRRTDLSGCLASPL